jgi:hypothetical protein
VIFFFNIPALDVKNDVSDTTDSWWLLCWSGGVPLSGELHGVTVGEKLGPLGVLRQLGVRAWIPRSFNIDASPVLTENVLHEFLRERPRRGVGGALQNVIKEVFKMKIK